MCPHLITDRHFLTDNLLCLVSNAAKYSDRGAIIDLRVSLIEMPLPPPSSSFGPRLASSSLPSMKSQHVISTSSRQQQQREPAPAGTKRMVMVMVEDTGIGLADEEKDIIFEPFKQAQRSAGGTGLGLFSLAGRIRALRGEFGVTDREDGKQGSVFWFTFPYRPDEASVQLSEEVLIGDDDGNDVDIAIAVVAAAAVAATTTATAGGSGSGSGSGRFGQITMPHQRHPSMAAPPAHALVPATVPVIISAATAAIAATAALTGSAVSRNSGGSAPGRGSSGSGGRSVSPAPAVQPHTMVPVPVIVSAATAATAAAAATGADTAVAAAVAAAAVAAAAVVAAAVVTAAARLPSLRVLVTDDAPSILKVMTRFLEANGHTVETAENGNQSLELLKSRLDDFDLMITDLNMPVMDGYESVKRFREWESKHGSVPQDGDDGEQMRFPIIAMSANADEETLHDVMAVGVDAFIAKPFDYKTLVRELLSTTLMNRVMVRRDVVDVMEVEESAKAGARQSAKERRRGAVR